MNTKDFKYTLNQFEQELGVKLFTGTRKREAVEARALFYHYLSKYKGYGLVEITRLVERETGYKPNHATIHHAKEMYDVYAAYNLRLNDALKSVVGHFNTKSDKQQYIKNHITKLPTDVINDVHRMIEIEYSKVLTLQAERLAERTQ